MSPAFDRGAFAVLDVCGALHGSFAGTGETLRDDRLADLVRWLAWRLVAGWEPSPLESTAVYDAAVHTLGVAALALARQEIAERAARAPAAATRDVSMPKESRE